MRAGINGVRSRLDRGDPGAQLLGSAGLQGVAPPRASAIEEGWWSEVGKSEGYSKWECAGSVSFSQVSNLTATEDREERKYYETMHLDETEMPPLTFITEIARGLRKAMKLHLFNFDMIRDTKVGNHYLVIDINYFPGYAKMPCYEAVLTDFFWDIVHQKSSDQLGATAKNDGVVDNALASRTGNDGVDVKIPARNHVSALKETINTG